MKVHFLKLMYHDKLGKIKAGTVTELPDHQAQAFLSRGIVERYETKVIRQQPFQDAGMTQPSSASPAVEVLPLTTSKPLKRGGRPRKKLASL
jgi:hypothetical protein